MRIFLLLIFGVALQAQTIFHQPGLPGTSTGTVLCLPFVPADGQTIVWSALRGCWALGVGSGGGTQADWLATSGPSQILNKPTLGAAAFLNVGNTAGTVAAGNHLHTGVYEPVVAPGITSQFYRGDKTWQDFATAAIAAVTWSTLSGKPSFATVATSGLYSDLSGRPTIPTITGSAPLRGSSGNAVPAVYTDIVGLWDPSCTGFLKNDGTCATTSGMVFPSAGVAVSSGSAWSTPLQVGTSAFNLVQLNSFGQLPALNANLLTNFPTLNQSTTGTAGGFNAQYIDWSALSGPQSIANKPLIPVASGMAPLMDGAADSGISVQYARGDHVHPTDTSRQAVITGAPGTWPTGTPNRVVATDPSGSSTNAAALRALVDLDVPTSILRKVQTVFDPVQTTLPATGNFQTSIGLDTYAAGLLNPANYGNIAGSFHRTSIFNGRNSHDNTDKKSLFGRYIWTNFPASGQKFGLENVVNCSGAGDCYGYNGAVGYDSRNTAFGDEGVTALSAGITQRDHLVRQTTTSLTKSSCAVTALAASVVKSTAPGDLKTVAVTGPTAACNVGDWLTIDQGIIGSTDTNVEVLQITGKTSGTITAQFQAAHASSAPVAASPVLGVSGTEYGQDAVIVDMDAGATTYSVGTAYPNANGNNGFTGIGTTWKSGHANGPIGGDANLPGCISFVNEDFSAYFTFAGGNGPVKWWYPIQSFTDDTHGVMADLYPGSLPATGASYIIRPCALNGANQISTSGSAESISALVLRSNAFPWTSGHLIENSISPYTSIYHAVHIPWFHWGPIGQAPQMLLIDNLGYAEAKTGVSVHDTGNFDGVTTFPYNIGINLVSATRNQNMFLGGRSGSGTGIQLLTSSGPDDFHQICWGNTYTACIWPSGDGFNIAPQNASKIKLTDSSHNFGPTFDFTPSTSAFVSNTITIPAASGTMALQVGGYMTRTIPATVNDEVDIGSFVLNANEANFDAYVSTANNTTHRYAFAISYTGDDVWRIVAPLASSGGYATYDYALDVRSRAAGAYELRLRKTVGSGTTTAQVTVAGNPPGTFTPSTSTASVSAPSVWWGSSVLGELANKATLTNATGFVATLDSSALTAARTITIPDIGGTLGLISGSITTGHAVCFGAGPTLQDTGCGAAGTVTTSGSPLIHQLAVFTGGSAITGLSVGATDKPLVGVTSGDPIFSNLILTNPGSPATFTLAGGKTLTASNTLSFTGADGSSVAFGGGGTVAYTIAFGSTALGTSAISANSCATTVTASATGVATTDVINPTPNARIATVTGYGALTTDGLQITWYPTANNVNFDVCNTTGSSVTPGAVTLNWRVAR